MSVNWDDLDFKHTEIYQRLYKEMEQRWNAHTEIMKGVTDVDYFKQIWLDDENMDKWRIKMTTQETLWAIQYVTDANCKFGLELSEFMSEFFYYEERSFNQNIIWAMLREFHFDGLKGHENDKVFHPLYDNRFDEFYVK